METRIKTAAPRKKRSRKQKRARTTVQSIPVKNGNCSCFASGRARKDGGIVIDSEKYKHRSGNQVRKASEGKPAAEILSETDLNTTQVWMTYQRDHEI